MKRDQRRKKPTQMKNKERVVCSTHQLMYGRSLTSGYIFFANKVLNCEETQIIGAEIITYIVLCPALPMIQEAQK